MKRVSHWGVVVETIRSRLQSWKAKTLSMGGRLTLIKSVLSSLPIYYLSLYKAPVAVIEQIERIMRGFLWAGASEERRMHWVSWDVVTTTKKMGGVGVSKLSDVNVALLVTWAWRFKSDKDCLWRRVVETIHGGRDRWMFLPSKSSFPGCWKSIAPFLDRIRLQGKCVNLFIRGRLGNGDRVRFWKDVWFGSVPLMERWPQLFGLEKKKIAW